MNIKETILSEVNAFAKRENVKILFVIETGSRAYGLEGRKSDYDVRFVYVRPKEFYLKLDKNGFTDTIDLLHSEELDIVGWDITKFLLLMKKSNPTVFEWIQCDSYFVDKRFLPIITTAANYYNYITVMYHYYYMYKNHDNQYITGKAHLTKKRYLHAIRAVLSAEWAFNYRTYVPLSFERLETLVPVDLLPIVDGIVVDKKCGLGNVRCDNIPQLDKWLEREANWLAVIVQEHSPKELKLDSSLEELDEIFLKILED